MNTDQMTKSTRAAAKTTAGHANAGILRTAQMDLATPAPYDIVEQSSIDSFPASDPPAWTCGVDTADGRRRRLK